MVQLIGWTAHGLLHCLAALKVSATLGRLTMTVADETKTFNF
ncbi:hypothetical protein [Marinicella litoralis]|uniref:Uncharacterized protein n=1 Tax=Marinicella litoralis TaxID=644220 RepID=A0A4R6XV11_9GAMM|nr:hypothetical protein [Marinicella litoralis]TDR22369.1 hypothetical protein C8D91_0857 [Marinicella litoralis]